MKPIFQKNLLFEDIWPRNRQNLVVFLQFAGPVNVFLFQVFALVLLVIKDVPLNISVLRY